MMQTHFDPHEGGEIEGSEMNSITTKSCAQCAYSAYEGDEVFTCRRFPPFGPPVMEDGEWHWYPVEVAPYHWCGEFKAETVSATPPATSEE